MATIVSSEHQFYFMSVPVVLQPQKWAFTLSSIFSQNINGYYNTPLLLLLQSVLLLRTFGELHTNKLHWQTDQKKITSRQQHQKYSEILLWKKIILLCWWTIYYFYKIEGKGHELQPNIICTIVIVLAKQKVKPWVNENSI